MDKNTSRKIATDTLVTSFKQEVHNAVSHHIDSNNDLESRKKNLIIYKISELDSNITQERTATDAISTKQWSKEALGVELLDNNIIKLFRLGKRNMDTPRPLLLALSDEKKKWDIIKNLGKLKSAQEKYKNISVSHDLPPAKREEMKKKLAEEKEKYQNNPEAENCKFLVVGHYTKMRVIRIQK